MPKFPKLPKNASRQENETFLDKIIESGSGKTARKVDYFRGSSFPAFRLYNNADPSRGVGQEYENQYHLKPTAVRREALKQIRKNPNEGFEIREVQIGTGWDPNVHHTIWRYDPPKPRRRPIPKNTPVFVPINTADDLSFYMESQDAGLPEGYSLEDIRGDYWPIYPQDQVLRPEVYKKARRSGIGLRELADDPEKDIIYMYGNAPALVDRIPVREYIDAVGDTPSMYGLKKFPWDDEY